MRCQSVPVLPRGISALVFEQGEDAGTIFDREVAPEHPLFAMTTYEIDATRRSVEARSVLGLGAMRAVHRPGFGCTLLVDTTAEALRTQAEAYHRSIPGSANPVTGLRKAVDTRWVDFLNRYLDEPTQTSLRTTKAILVSHRGKLLAEGYGEGIGAETPLLGWSMTKSALAYWLEHWFRRGGRVSTKLGSLSRGGPVVMHGPISPFGSSLRCAQAWRSLKCMRRLRMRLRCFTALQAFRNLR